MNKTRGWTSIILSILGSITLWTVFIVMPFIYKEKMSVGELPYWKLIIVLLLFQTYLILIFAGGLKNIKKEQAAEVNPYTDKLDIHVSGQLAYKRYRKLMLTLMFKKTGSLKIILVFTGLIIVNWDTNFSAGGMNILAPFSVLLLVIAYMSFRMLATFKKSFDNNKNLSTPVSYHLYNEGVHAKSASVDATLKWSLFVKSKETSDFILLYQSDKLANFLDKQWFSETDLNQFKRFLLSLDIKKE